MTDTFPAIPRYLSTLQRLHLVHQTLSLFPLLPSLRQPTMAQNAHLHRRDSYWPFLFLLFNDIARAVCAEKWLFLKGIFDSYRKFTLLAEQAPECCFGGRQCRQRFFHSDCTAASCVEPAVAHQEESRNLGDSSYRTSV